MPMEPGGAVGGNSMTPGPTLPAIQAFNFLDGRFGRPVGTNYTAVIQDAITYAATQGGGFVFGPAGTYNYTTLLIPAKVTLCGAGMGVTIFTKTGTDVGAAIFGIRLQGDMAGLRDCTANGSGFAGNFATAVAITDSAKHCLVTSVEIANAWLGCVAGGIVNDPARRWNDCSYNTVEDCWVHDVGQVTVQFYAPQFAFGNIMVNCLTVSTHDAAGSGNELRNQFGSKILGCQAEGLRSSFRFEESSAYCVISNCTSIGASREGFLALGAFSSTGATGETNNCVISNCASFGDAEGFVINTADDVTISNCITTGALNAGAAAAGFRITAGNAQGLSRSARSQIIGCRASGGLGHGFYVEGNAGDGSGIGLNSWISGFANGQTRNGVFIVGGGTETAIRVDVRCSNNAAGDFQINKNSTNVVVPIGEAVVLLNGAAANVTPNSCTGTLQKIRVTSAGAFTVNSPTNENAGALFTVSVENASGGAMGAITWGAKFHLAGAFVNPATGNLREITFRYDSSNSVFREINRTAADQLV